MLFMKECSHCCLNIFSKMRHREITQTTVYCLSAKDKTLMYEMKQASVFYVGAQNECGYCKRWAFPRGWKYKQNKIWQPGSDWSNVWN